MNKKLSILLGILVCVGGLSILIFWNAIADKAQTLVLFVTLIIITVYVIDTHRIANSAAMQSRIYWISNLFVSLSVRTAGFIKDIEGPSLFPEQWAVHTREMRSLLEVLLHIWPSTSGRDHINAVLEECSTRFQTSPMMDQDKADLISFLLRVKRELQIMVGQLS